MKILGLSGPAGAGKDTVAAFLYQHYQFHQVAFAGPLKAGAMAMFGFSPEQVHDPRLKEVVDDFWGYSPRTALQKLGTEAMRTVFGQDFWVRTAKRRVDMIHNAGFPVVITDVRFDNEAEAIKSWGGQVWRIERPNHSLLKAENQKHASEAGISEHLIDYTIFNEGSLIDLEDFVLEAAKECLL